MLAVNYSTIRNSFKDYCDKAINGEEVIVTRKEEKNVVIISLEKYNQMLKEINNVKIVDTPGFDTKNVLHNKSINL